MKCKTFFSLMAATLVAVGSGCVSTPTGDVPALTFEKYSRVSKYQRSVEQIAKATEIVLKRNGKLIVENVVNNTFQARINERNVWVRITKVDEKLTQVEVMARTDVGGDIDLAAEIDKQIALQLTVSPSE